MAYVAMPQCGLPEAPSPCNTNLPRGAVARTIEGQCWRVGRSGQSCDNVCSQSSVNVESTIVGSRRVEVFNCLEEALRPKGKDNWHPIHDDVHGCEGMYLYYDDPSRPR